MPGNIRILILGDVVAKIGRRAVREILPLWKKKFAPDAIIANVENLAHGKGITESSLKELRDAGVTVCTAGNHVWHKEDPQKDSIRQILPIVLAANDSRTDAHARWHKLLLGNTELFVVNLQGQVFMADEFENPFLVFDKLYDEMGRPKHLIVDLHAEATSEKVAFGYYADGRASLVYGTHTHIPTADERILPDGCGYITDCGMVGARESVLGVAKETIIKRFLGQGKEVFIFPENGPAWVNALLCELDEKTGKCIQLKRLAETIIIK